MNAHSLIKFARSGALSTLLALSMTSVAHAQTFTYTYYPDNATINSAVATDFAIVGYAGGYYDENDFSRHFTSPSSPTVEVAAGANIVNEMDTFNHSVVNVSGGSGSIVPYDNSVVNVSGGSVSILSYENSVVNVSGGNLGGLQGQGKQINVSGGTVGFLVANDDTDGISARLGSCIVNLTGGKVTGEVDAYNAGILNLRGGVLDGDLYARFGGTINIYGSNLVPTLIDSSNRGKFSLYSLSGVLEDGTVIKNKNLFIENDGVTYGHSSFTLVNAVPEPGSLALLFGIGVSGTGFVLRRRK